MSRVLVTGAAGYIGSHACVALLQAGHEVVGIDNFDNSSPAVLLRVEELARPLSSFHEVDICHHRDVDGVFATEPIDAVMHFAGVKAVSDSVADPVRYYGINVGGTLNLLQVMKDRDVSQFIFSSSCTVYGEVELDRSAVNEATPTKPTNPYGRSKLMVEQLLADVAVAHDWQICALRYFNPVGAHESGRLGEAPTGTPHNLFPLAMQVASGQLPALAIYGNDHPTPDGTCIRDYVHVVDVVEGHLAALDGLRGGQPFEAINLGTGRGTSVLEVIQTVERVTGRPVPKEVATKRAGDATALYADTSYAAERLGWKADRDLDQMVHDYWHWHVGNPDGYG